MRKERTATVESGSEELVRRTVQIMRWQDEEISRMARAKGNQWPVAMREIVALGFQKLRENEAALASIARKN